MTIIAIEYTMWWYDLENKSTLRARVHWTLDFLAVYEIG